MLQSELDVWVRFRPSDHTAAAGAASEATATSPDSAISRTISAFLASISAFPEYAPIWQSWLEHFKTDCFTTFLNGSNTECAARLNDPQSTLLHYGFDEICEQRPDLRHGISHIIHSPDWIYDLLRRIGEAVGVLRLEYPELMPGTPDATPSTEDILLLLDQAFGFRIDFPNPLPGETGLATSRGVASFRAVQSLFQAWKIDRYLRGKQKRRVAEIGGGLGRTAYYAHRFGFDSYYIVDIPLTSVAQANYLSRILPQDALTLFNEPAGGNLHILPPPAFFELDPELDLIVNFDGLTEQPEVSAAQYWNHAKSRRIDFLSVNHEVNPVTFRNFYTRDREELGDVTIARSPYWLRRGYLEESVLFHAA